MGAKLAKYYKYITDEAGLGAKTKLAMTTKIPSSKAAMEADTPANVELFKKAIEQITGKPAPNF